MKTQFIVSKAGHLPVAKTFFVQGTLKAGKVNQGDVIHVNGIPRKQVRVKSVALVNSREQSEELTLSIEEPPFPTVELEGALLVSD